MYNRATAQSIVDGQETTILFNSMIFDSGNDYNGSTNPITANSGKFTAPADGLYHFDKAIDWDESFQATRVYLQIRHDNIGGTMKRMATQTGYFDNANTVEPHLSCSATFYMLANEKVYVRVSQNSNDGSPISHNLEPSVSCYFLGYLVR